MRTRASLFSFFLPFFFFFFFLGFYFSSSNWPNSCEADTNMQRANIAGIYIQCQGYVRPDPATGVWKHILPWLGGFCSPSADGCSLKKSHPR